LALLRRLSWERVSGFVMQASEKPAQKAPSVGRRFRNAPTPPLTRESRQKGARTLFLYFSILENGRFCEDGRTLNFDGAVTRHTSSACGAPRRLAGLTVRAPWYAVGL
jgi:hypothetical protein